MRDVLRAIARPLSVSPKSVEYSVGAAAMNVPKRKLREVLGAFFHLVRSEGMVS